MNRLRVRVELNRRRSGVPLDKLVSVVEETRKFFHLLAEDVEIPVDRGEWEASNFDPESLNFTAEYSGPASAEQISAFGSAFGGATSLRRETIAQFTHIADFIGEDELVGFGLYQSDQESEPSDWRCLSRRDALRFADEIRLLAKAAGESGTEAPLPAVMNGSVGGRRLFKDRREREALATDPSKWIRDVESTLSRRISLLESEVEAHAHKMHGLGNTQEAADERFLKLLGAMESFWSQAPRQLSPAGPEPAARGLASLGKGFQTVAGSLLASAPPPAQLRKSRLRWRLGLALAAAGLILAAIGALGMRGQWSRLSRSIDFLQITKPSSASSIQRAADPPNAQLLKAAIGTSGLEGGNPTQSAGQQTVSPGSASTPAENSAQVQVRQARSESGAGSPRRDPGVEMIHQITLGVPPDLRAMIREQVMINVTVDIDQTGRVTTAEVASAKGEEADLLTTEALKAARWFRFRPNRHGNKPVASQTVLTFVFDPDPEVSEGLPPGN
jgi:TonB family protein